MHKLSFHAALSRVTRPAVAIEIAGRCLRLGPALRHGVALALLAPMAPSVGAADFGTYSESNANTFVFGGFGSYGEVVDCIHVPAGVASPCGDGPRSAAAEGWTAVALAKANTAPSLGAINGEAQVFRAAVATDTRGTASVGATSYWFDTFTITSSSLPIGAPVVLSGAVRFEAEIVSPPDLGTCSIGGGGGCASAYAALRPFAPSWGPIAFVSSHTKGLNEPPGVITSPNPGLGTFSTHVGDTFQLFGTLAFNAQVAVGFGDEYSAWVKNAQALYYIDVLTPEAGYTTVSGRSYRVAAVPEPQTWLIALTGLALIGTLTRRPRSPR